MTYPALRCDNSKLSTHHAFAPKPRAEAHNGRGRVRTHTKDLHVSQPSTTALRQHWLALSAAAAAFLAGCTAPLPPSAPAIPTPQTPTPPPLAELPPPVAAEPMAKSEPEPPKTTAAMPPPTCTTPTPTASTKAACLPAVRSGLLEFQLDQMGNVMQLNWMRAPNHAPEVVAEIKRTV